MSELRVVYDDFSKGEYGHLGGAHAPNGSFTGRNVIVYRNGMIGPRPGLRNYNSRALTGSIAGFWWAHGASGKDAWWVTTTGDVRSISLTSGTITDIGTITAPGANNFPQAVDVGLGKYLLTVEGDTSYMVDLAAGDVDSLAIAAAPGGKDVAIHGERAYVANNGSDYFRVWYSAAGDFNTWDAGAYFDVGHQAGIAAIEKQRDHLAILLQDGSWWTFRGATAADGVLRKITPGGFYPWTLNPNAAAVLTDDRVLFMWPNGDWPIFFDGSSLEHDYNAGPRGDSQVVTDERSIHVAPTVRAGESMILGYDENVFYLYQNGAWTLHEVPTDAASFDSYVASSQQGIVALLDSVTNPDVWTFDFRIDRPAFSSDTFAQPGDLSDTPVDAYFTMPEWWAQPGTEVRVKQVVVDFVKYTTGATGSDCAFDLELDAFGMYENDDTASPTAQGYSESSGGSTDGIRDRKVFNVGEQGWGAGFQVGLSGIKGVSIKTITVVAETQPALPRY